MQAQVRLRITVRYFAAARAAAGPEAEVIKLPAGTTLADLVEGLKSRDADLAKLLTRCSYLCDGVAVRDTGMTLSDDQTVDVLPPFAGG